MEEIFEINQKKQIEKLEKEVTACNFSEIMKEETNKFAGKTKEEPPVLSTEDQEMKQLEDRRKDIEKEGKQIREKESREYRTEQNWKISADKDYKRNEQILLKLCFKVVEDQNIYTKEVQRKR